MIDLLRNTGLFVNTNAKKLAKIAAQIEEIHIPANITFITEGEKADALYIVKEGIIQVFTGEIILARLEKEAYFGEQALLNEIPGPRTASVRTLTEATLLKIKHDIFLETIATDEALKNELIRMGFQQLTAKLQAIEVVETLKNVYSSPERGKITQHLGNFLHMPAMIVKFKLPDGREIISHRVIGRNIQHIAEIQNGQKIIYEDKTTYRELHIHENRLVGLTSYGQWNEIKDLYSKIFDKTKLTDEELKLFKKTGSLTPSEIASTENSNDIICICMCVPKKQIQEAIFDGCASVEEVSNKTGAGSVCGSCIPLIRAMLGHDSWQAMHIDFIAQLTPDSRAYRLSPIKPIPLAKSKPGQHIVVQSQIDGKWIERCYTLISTPDSEFYEIAVKREENGLFSPWLFEQSEQIPFIRASQPQGNITIDPKKSNALVCITAGIGITPALCFARTLSNMQEGRPLLVLHSAHNSEQLAFDRELESLTNEKIKYTKRLTQENGRLQPQDIIAIAQQHKSDDFFICGPKEFESMVKTALMSSGIAENQICIERFTHATSCTS